MALCRILLAALIGLAVATAPVGAALASLASAQSSAKSVKAMEDCHAKLVKHCPDCDSKAKCPGDGSKCCKLTGTIMGLPVVMAVAVAIDRVAEPPEPASRFLRPLTPPPRT